MGSVKGKEINIAFAAADIVKQLRTANSLATGGTVQAKAIQSNIAKASSMYNTALTEVNDTLKKMDSLPKDLINMQEYNSLKSYSSSIPRKISELNKIGGAFGSLGQDLGGISTI